MRSCRPPLFWKRKFEPHALMAERGLAVDHTTIWRWAQRYGPKVLRRLGGEVNCKSSTWHMDETFVQIAGKQMYLFRAVDSHGQTVDFYLSETRDREAAKLFLRRAMANPDNPPPHVCPRWLAELSGSDSRAAE
jgi:IS6 family transposase